MKQLIIAVIAIIFSQPSFADYKSNLKYGDTRFCKSDCKYEFVTFRKFANKGSPIAQYTMGIMQLQAQGTEQNIEAGIRNIYYAAKDGDPGAQAQLGYFYLFGLYIDRDEKLGIKYLEMANKSKIKTAREVLSLYEELKSTPAPVVNSESKTSSNKSEVRAQKQLSNKTEVITIYAGLDYELLIQAAESQVCNQRCNYISKVAFAPRIRLSDSDERVLLQQLYL